MFRILSSTVAWTLLAFLCETCLPDPTKIHPDLSTILAENGKASVVVSFRDGIMSTLDSATAVRYDDRGTKNTAIKAALVENSDSSQAGVLQTLSARSGEGSDFQYYKQYWSSNKILIKEASADIINQVSEDPEVKMISELPVVSIPDEPSVATTRSETDEMTWGLNKIQISEAWEEAGNKGEGVVVGVIDTGVRSTHEALKDSFVGAEYGWYDTEFLKPDPYDNEGHGTHITGTIVGPNGMGVAPGVKWMACRMCRTVDCIAEGAMDCVQWMSCPTLSDGSNPDCSKAPHVINNSWGTLYYDGFYDEDIMRWRAMGIIPVFAMGNWGQICQNYGPGNTMYVIGVGATDEDDNVPWFSSTGPGIDNIQKPDVVAPGVDVLSSISDADDSYGLNNGTSMASPHVAGIVALLKGRDPDITYEEIYDLLIQNTDKEGLTVTLNQYCKNRNNPEEIPNDYFGYGRVNALSIMKAHTSMLNSRKK